MPKKIDPAVKERCVRQVLEHLPEYSSLTAAAEVVARREGLGKETVRRWVLQAQIDGGQRQGATSDELAEIRELKAKVRRLEEDKRDPSPGLDFLRRGTRPPQPLIVAFIDELRTEGHVVESTLMLAAGSCASRAARSPHGPTATGRAPTARSRPARSATPSSSTRSVAWRGAPTTRARAG